MRKCSKVLISIGYFSNSTGSFVTIIWLISVGYHSEYMLFYLFTNYHILQCAY